MESPLRNRLLAGFVALLLVIVGGTLGYWLIGNGQWSVSDCLYMTVITVTTVGYGEVLPGMDVVAHARTFTIVLLVFGTGVIVYFASTITAFVVEGDLKNLLKLKRLKKRIRRMKDHVIVCGAGSTGRHIVEELITASVPVVAIDRSESQLRELTEKFPRAELGYVVGDATNDEVLEQAGLVQASGVVATLSSDKDNLYVVVSARLLNSRARIIARCAELNHVDKIKRAGADGVVSPNHIGGMRMASELLRPEVVRFLDEMLRDKRALMRIDQVRIGPSSALDGAALRDAEIRERYGMTVLAVRATDDAPWVYNPEPTQALRSGTTVVVLGSAEQVSRLRAAVG
jgi:voltage-gated potassium channel